MKKFFTKRNVLFAVNIVYLILMVLACTMSILTVFGDNTVDYTKEVFLVTIGYIGSQASFTALSLIVYYLAIMAGALNKKYKEEVKNSEEDK